MVGERNIPLLTKGGEGRWEEVRDCKAHREGRWKRREEGKEKARRVRTK